MGWYSENNENVYSTDQLLKLHDTWTNEQIDHLDFFYKYRNYYTAMLLGLLTAYTTLFLNYYEKASQMIIVLIIIPASIIILSKYGEKSIDRYYGRFLETVILISKIESLLGIDGQIASEKGKPEEIIYPEDSYFMIERFVESRKKFNTSKEWKKNMMKLGDNEWAHKTFNFIKNIGFILLVWTIGYWVYMMVLKFNLIANILNVLTR